MEGLRTQGRILLMYIVYPYENGLTHLSAMYFIQCIDSTENNKWSEPTKYWLQPGALRKVRVGCEAVRSSHSSYGLRWSYGQVFRAEGQGVVSWGQAEGFIWRKQPSRT